ncbi:MAG: signal peptidase I [Verrucomicrobiota bacterium]
MRQFIFFLIEFLLFYFLFGHVLVRKFLSKRRKALQAVKEHEHFVGKIIKVNRDLISSESIAQLRALKERLHRLKKTKTTSVDDAYAALEETESVCEKHLPAKCRKRSAVAEYLEVAVVALGIAFAVRGFALQPFKIPTGSMEPTLHGINFIEQENVEVPSSLVRGFEYLNYSRRYVDATVETSGRVRRIQQKRVLLWSSVEVQIGDVTYTLPGTLKVLAEADDTIDENLAEIFGELVDARRTSIVLEGNAPYYEDGAVLAKGYLEAGDHLFVDRLSWNFTEPERGDITVFTTTGLKSRGEEGLSGRYYIKRLVGLPGDELKIENRKLYIKKAGDDEFKLMDDEIDPAFSKIHARENDYHGYTQNPDASHLTSSTDTFKVPDNHYFMLGDNSSHSLDSRFWGAVPRENLVGRAALVWWPFSPRWGIAGRIIRDEQ